MPMDTNIISKHKNEQSFDENTPKEVLLKEVYLANDLLARMTAEREKLEIKLKALSEQIKHLEWQQSAASINSF